MPIEDHSTKQSAIPPENRASVKKTDQRRHTVWGSHTALTGRTGQFRERIGRISAISVGVDTESQYFRHYIPGNLH